MTGRSRPKTLRRNPVKEATMNRKTKIGIAALVIAAAAAAAGSAFAHAPKTITIRHQIRGCHTWSFVGGPYKAALKVKIDRDTTLVFVDNDVMPHKLIQLSGPKASLTSPNMNHMGAKAVAVFSKSGVYKFTTKPGEDYMKGMKTIGPDNVLRLTVTVS
jgi:plastocyanin